MTNADGNETDRLTREELHCLDLLYRHQLQAEPPLVLTGVAETTLHRLETRGLVKRVTEPMLPLEMKRVNYRLTAAGVAAYLASQSR